MVGSPLSLEEIIGNVEDDELWYINYAVLNPNMPEEVLRKLKSVYVNGIATCVALNPSTPIEVLEELAKEFPEYVAENPNVPLHLLESFVEKRLKEGVSSSIMSQIVSHQYRKSKIGTTIEDVLFSYDQFGRVVYGIILNPKVPGEVLEKLVNDPLSFIREKIAMHPNTPPDSLRKLAEEYPGYVAINPNTPPDLLRELAKEYPNSVAQNPNTPSDVLQEMVQSLIREAEIEEIKHIMRMSDRVCGEMKQASGREGEIEVQ